MKIKDHVVMITGGGSGMGAKTACHLTELGAKVAILDTHLEAARIVAKECDTIAVECDVRYAESVQSALAEVLKAFGQIHVVISCAGIAPVARIVSKSGPMPLQDFDRAIQVNLIGTFNVMRLTAAQMIQQKPLTEDGERGVLINTASVAAFEGQIGQSAYSASKGGVVSMTLPAARELSQFGIRVMTIAPGVIATPMMEGMPDVVEQSLVASIPFPKRLGHPHEFASLVQQIIENSYLNGSIIRLDGGLRMSER